MKMKRKEEELITISNVIIIVEIICKKFVSNGSIQTDQFEDLKQSILEKYLLKKDRILNSFNRTAKIETYISSVIYRMALEVLRSKLYKRHENSDPIKLSNYNNELDPEEQVILKYEKEYLERVLLTLGKNAKKIILFCKVFFRIMIIKKDLIDYISFNILEKVLKELNRSTLMKDKEVYEMLSKIENQAENKNTKADAVRMFILKQIQKIAERMNFGGRAKYTKESLQILFEITFSKNSALTEN